MPRCACPFAPLLEDSRRGAKRSEEHTSELQSRLHLVCRLLLEKKKNKRGTARASVCTEPSCHYAHEPVCDLRGICGGTGKPVSPRSACCSVPEVPSPKPRRVL